MTEKRIKLYKSKKVIFSVDNNKEYQNVKEHEQEEKSSKIA